MGKEGFSRWLCGNESTCQCRRLSFNPWVGKINLEEEMATRSSILAWRIPWTQEPGGLQSMGSQRVRRDLAIKTTVGEEVQGNPYAHRQVARPANEWRHIRGSTWIFAISRVHAQLQAEL